MPWLAAIFLGLLTGVVAAIYAGFVADLAVPWLRISQREGNAGFFVLGMGLLGFIGGSVVGIAICRLAGHAEPGGTWRGFGLAVLVVGGVISALGTWAWTLRDVARRVGGQPVDLAIELRLPPGAARPAEGDRYVYLLSGARQRSSSGSWQPAEARLEQDRWIVPGRIALTTSEGGRSLHLGGTAAAAAAIPLPVPARPAALDAAFGPWIAGDGWELRYRIEPHRPPPPSPPPPGEAELRRAAFAALPPDAPTAALLGFASAIWRDQVYDDALRAARARPDFAAALAARIAAPDHDAARDAMYVVGEMRPPPAGLGDAVRARAAEVVRIAEAIDPAAEDSRDRLHAQAHTLVTGIVAASFGLRAAGVDLRPELRAIAAPSRPREKAPPHAIADMAERVAAHFDQPDAEPRMP